MAVARCAREIAALLRSRGIELEMVLDESGVIGEGTDARHYADLSRSVFRFLPLRLTSRDLERMHGIDERIGIREYEGDRELVVSPRMIRRLGRRHLE